jgi:copper chaperone CopZ
MRSNPIECFVEPVLKPWDPKPLPEATVACLGVSGMGCDGCEQRVRNCLLKLDGVLLANVSLKDNAATVVYDPMRAGVADLIRAIENAAGDDGRMFRAALYFQIPAGQAYAI